MTVSELLKRISETNKDALVSVIVNNQPMDFSLVWGGSEGSTKATSDTLSFYVDELCSSERKG